jgi:hypothetical protein
MTTSADHHPTPATRPPGLPDAVRAELAKLRGRILGTCATCGHTVYLEHNFTRLNGRVLHVRCPISSARAVSQID